MIVSVKNHIKIYQSKSSFYSKICIKLIKKVFISSEKMKNSANYNYIRISSKQNLVEISFKRISKSKKNGVGSQFVSVRRHVIVFCYNHIMHEIIHKKNNFHLTSLKNLFR